MRKNLSKADTMRLKTYRAMINAGSKHLAYGSKKWRTFTRYMFDGMEALSGFIPDKNRQDPYYIQFNAPWVVAKTILANLIFRAPIPKVTPKRPEFAGGAKLMQAVQTYFIIEGFTPFHKELRNVVCEAIFKNLSLLKQGYCKNKGVNTLNALLFEEREEVIPREDFNKQVSDVLKKSSNPLGEVALRQDAPMEGWWCKRVSADNLLLPFGIEYLNEAPWAIEIIRKETHENIGEYNRSFEDTQSPTKDSPLTDNYGRVLTESSSNYTIFELYDRRDPKEPKIVHLAEGTKGSETDLEILHEMDWKLPCDDFPYSALTLNQVPGCFYSMPDIQFYETFGQAITEVLNNYLVGTRRNNPIIGTLPSFDSKNKRKIIQARGLTFIEMDGQNEVFPIKFESPYLDFGYLNVLVRFLDQFSGVNEMNRGGAGAGDTATENMLVSQGSSARNKDMNQIVEDYVGEILKKNGQFIQAFVKDGTVIRIAPHLLEENGNEIWRTFNRKDIQGDFIYKVTPGSMKSDPSFEEKRQWYEFYNIAAQDSQYNGWEVRRAFLDGYFGGNIDPSRFVLPERNADAEKLAELENKTALLEGKLPPAMQGENHQVHLQLHGAFTQKMPDFMLQRIEAIKTQAAPFLQKAQQEGKKIEGSLPDEFKTQLQGIMSAWNTAVTVVQEHMKTHEELAQKTGAQPINYNKANQSLQKTQGKGKGTQVNLGGTV